MEFLLLFEIGIILCETLKSQLIHEVNKLGIRHILLLESSDGNWISGGEQRNLFVRWHQLNYLSDNNLEVVGEKFVDFIEHHHHALVELGNVLRGQIKDTTWGSDDDVVGLIESEDVLFDWVTSR